MGVVLGTAMMAFTKDGLTSAAGWFQLTQGVGGVALGWLFTSQGMDAALLLARLDAAIKESREARERFRRRVLEGRD